MAMSASSETVRMLRNAVAWLAAAWSRAHAVCLLLQAELIEQKNQENDVVIYSKSYCPFSVQVWVVHLLFFAKADSPAAVIVLISLHWCRSSSFSRSCK